MRTFVAVLVLLAPIANGAKARPQSDRLAPKEWQPLPPLVELGLGMVPDSKAVVGACCCHSPFANAGIMGGDRIVSVDGRNVDSIASLRTALGLARPKRSIKFAVVGAFGLGDPHPKTVVVEFPPDWWNPARVKK